MNFNHLDNNQRRYLQVGIIAILIVFLIYWFYLSKEKPMIDEPVNREAYIQDSSLYAFGDTYVLSAYPNHIEIHYPYLLVILPTEQRTVVYNLDQKIKENEFDHPLLDYDGTSTLRNDGKTTFINDRNLNILCEKGFIKDEYEVLCLTKIKPDNMENKLVTIDLQTNEQTDIYVSKNLITSFSSINGEIYIGEHELYTKQNYILLDDEKIKLPSVGNLIYGVNKEVFFITLLSQSNPLTQYSLQNQTMSPIYSDTKIFLSN